MTFPTTGTPTTSHDNANTTSHVVTLPNGVDVVGTMVVVAVAKDGSGVVTWPASPAWTVINDGTSGGAASYQSVRYHVVDGTEGWASTGQTITVTGSNEEWASYAIGITGQHPTQAPEKTASGTTGTSLNVASLTPSWGAEDTLWLYFSSVDGQQTVGFPTAITDNQHSDNNGNSTGVSHACGTRTVNQASLDPSAVTITSAGWTGVIVAIRPAPAGTFADVDLGAMTMSGLTLDTVNAVDLPLASLTMAGLNADTVSGQDVPLGGLTLAGLAPDTANAIDIALGNLTLSGLGVDTANVIDVALGSLATSGYVPSTAISVDVALGALFLDGLAPDSSTGVVMDVDLGTLALTGLGPTVSVASDAALGLLTFMGLTPDTVIVKDVSTGILAIAGLPPDIAVMADVASGIIEFTGIAPDAVVVTETELGQLLLTGFPPLTTAILPKYALSVDGRSFILYRKALPKLEAERDADV